MTHPHDLALSVTELNYVRTILKDTLPNTARVWIFGSRCNPPVKAHADLDLAIEDHTPLDLSVQADLQDAFDESPLPWRVDIVDLKTISPEFRDHIIQSRKPFPL